MFKLSEKFLLFYRKTVYHQFFNFRIFMSKIFRLIIYYVLKIISQKQKESLFLERRHFTYVKTLRKVHQSLQINKEVKEWYSEKLEK